MWGGGGGLHPITAPPNPPPKVHRRLLYDDNRGVGEALSEDGRQGALVRGTHRVLLERPSMAADGHRLMAQEMAAAPHVILAASGSPKVREVGWRTAHPPAVNPNIWGGPHWAPPPPSALTPKLWGSHCAPPSWGPHCVPPPVTPNL